MPRWSLTGWVVTYTVAGSLIIMHILFFIPRLYILAGCSSLFSELALCLYYRYYSCIYKCYTWYNKTENWTVRVFLQLTPRLSNDITAVWLTFTFPQLFAVAATLKSIDYNVAMTFILNNNTLIPRSSTWQDLVGPLWRPCEGSGQISHSWLSRCIDPATIVLQCSIIIIIINLFATNQNIHNNHRVYMMAGRQKN